MTVSLPYAKRVDDSGFTLVEGLAVLAIVALTSAFIFTQLPKGNRTAEVRSTAVAVATELRYLRTEALRTATRQAMTIDLDSRKFWSSRVQTKRNFPLGINISVARDRERINSSGLFDVPFEADGSSTGGTIFMSSSNARAEVVVDWMTGSSLIEWQR